MHLFSVCGADRSCLHLSEGSNWASSLRVLLHGWKSIFTKLKNFLAWKKKVLRSCRKVWRRADVFFLFVCFCWGKLLTNHVRRYKDAVVSHAVWCYETQQTSDWTLIPNFSCCLARTKDPENIQQVSACLPAQPGRRRSLSDLRGRHWEFVRKAFKHNSDVLFCLDFKSLNVF